MTFLHKLYLICLCEEYETHVEFSTNLFSGQHLESTILKTINMKIEIVVLNSKTKL